MEAMEKKVQEKLKSKRDNRQTAEFVKERINNMPLMAE